MTKPEFIARQGRKPSGFLGHVVAWIMAKETRPENDRTLELLELKDYDAVLEIGFGHGETLQRAARQVKYGQLAGVDFSDVMIARASNLNRGLIRQGRLDLRSGEGRELPFGPESFTKVFTVHTVYFLADLSEDFEEVYRVLKPGGRFVIGYRSSEDERVVSAFPDTVYQFRSVGEVEETLQRIGFSDVRTQSANARKRLTHWTIAQKRPVTGLSN